MLAIACAPSAHSSIRLAAIVIDEPVVSVVPLVPEAIAAYQVGAESGLPRPLKHAITDTEVVMELRDKHLARGQPQVGGLDAQRDHLEALGLHPTETRPLPVVRRSMKPVLSNVTCGEARR